MGCKAWLVTLKQIYLPLLWSGLLFSQVCNPDGLTDALWGAIIGYGTHSLSFAGGIACCVIRKKLGYGDVKFSRALGAACTDAFLPRLVFLAASAKRGAVVVGLLMREEKESLKTRCRLGPFLAAAGFVNWKLGWLLAGR